MAAIPSRRSGEQELPPIVPPCAERVRRELLACSPETPLMRTILIDLAFIKIMATPTPMSLYWGNNFEASSLIR